MPWVWSGAFVLVFTVLEQSWNLFSENVHLPKTAEIAKRNLGAYPGGLQDVTSRPVYPGCISHCHHCGLLWMWQQISSRPQSQSASQAKNFCKAECFQRIFKTQFRNRGIWGPLGNVPWGGGSTGLVTRSRRCYVTNTHAAQTER